MRIDTYKFPKSSFLSVEKDYSLIMDNLMKNERLKKLLYYPYRDALNRPNLNQEQTKELFGDYIRISPNYKISNKEKNYLIINFTEFYGNTTDFKEATLVFDIVLHLDNYLLDDYKLRGYKIAAEINEMMKQKTLNNMGKIDQVLVETRVLDDEFVLMSVAYKLYHMTED
jgi:hypothetical protein